MSSASSPVAKSVNSHSLRVTVAHSAQFCTLKRISAEVGWGYKDVVDRLEEKRKVKGKAYYERKVGPPSVIQEVVLMCCPCSKLRSSCAPRQMPVFLRTSCLSSLAISLG